MLKLSLERKNKLDPAIEVALKTKESNTLNTRTTAVHKIKNTTNNPHLNFRLII
jgi:hypothetical protein